MKLCKYYNKNMDWLKKLCETLYSLPNCGAGGNLHILLDDDNYDDDSVMFCLKECLLNPEHPSSSLGILICTEILKMSMAERSVFIRYWLGFKLDCCSVCDSCELMDEDIAYLEVDDD